MANEINHPYRATGATLYAVMRQVSGQRWNASTLAFETLTVANWANYGLPLAETPAGGYFYIGSLPAIGGVMVAGWYWVDLYAQAGETAAVSDVLVASYFGHWDGTHFTLQGADNRNGNPIPTGAAGGAGSRAIQSLRIGDQYDYTLWVYDPATNALCDVDGGVTIAVWHDGAVDALALSNGNFSVQHLATGIYRITATAPYASATRPYPQSYLPGDMVFPVATYAVGGVTQTQPLDAICIESAWLPNGASPLTISAPSQVPSQPALGTNWNSEPTYCLLPDGSRLVLYSSNTTMNNEGFGSLYYQRRGLDGTWSGPVCFYTPSSPFGVASDVEATPLRDTNGNLTGQIWLHWKAYDALPTYAHTAILGCVATWNASTNTLSLGTLVTIYHAMNTATPPAAPTWVPQSGSQIALYPLASGSNAVSANNRALQLPDGSLLLAINGGLTAAGTDATDSVCVIHAVAPYTTWTLGATVANGPAMGQEMSETELTLLPGGEIVALIRSDSSGTIWRASSPDLGATWVGPRRAFYVGHGGKPAVVRTPSGVSLLLTRAMLPLAGPSQTTSTLLAVSWDEQQTWYAVQWLTPPNGDQYGELVLIDDSTVSAIYASYPSPSSLALYICDLVIDPLNQSQVADAVTDAVTGLTLDGVSWSRFTRALLAVAGGKLTVTDNGDGTCTANFLAQDGTTLALSVTFNKATGARTASAIGS